MEIFVIGGRHRSGAAASAEGFILHLTRYRLLLVAAYK
jgi:hypothetical protein